MVQSWLASVIYAVLDRVGGPDAIRLFMGATTALLAALSWRLTAPARSLIVRVGVTALVLGVGAATWFPRPLTLGLVFLAVTLLVVQRQLPAPILLPLFWLWVNTHGSFPLGLVAVACLAVGSKLDGDAIGPEMRALAWAVGGTILGAINPLGPKLLTFPIYMLGRQELLSEIVEWQSPDFSSLWTRLFLVQVALAIVALTRRPSWRAAVPTIVFLVAALFAARNIAVASLVLLPGMAYGLEGIGSLEGRERGKAPIVVLALVALVALLAGSARLSDPSYDLRDFPVDAVAFLDQEGLVGPGSDSRSCRPTSSGTTSSCVRNRCPGVPRRSTGHVPPVGRGGLPDPAPGGTGLA